MKRFSIPALALTIALTVSACGAKTTLPPTISAVDVQSTIAAVALTMYAGTVTALPTATPLPPTQTSVNTLVPITAFVPSPSAPELTLTAAPTSNAGGGDQCTIAPMPAVLHGETIKMRINNSTKVALRLSVYLNDPTQCGYRAYNLEPEQSLVLTDLVEGCYTLYAWNPDQKNYFIVTNGTNCVDSTYPSTFDISTRDIRIR